jgi:hypothetical protein
MVSGKAAPRRSLDAVKRVGLLVAWVLSAGGCCSKPTKKKVSAREVVAVVAPATMKTYVVAENAVVHYSAGLEGAGRGVGYESGHDQHQVTFSLRADVEGKLAFNEEITSENCAGAAECDERAAHFEVKACAYPAGAVLLYKVDKWYTKRAVVLFGGRSFRYEVLSLQPWPACEEIAAHLPPAPDLVAVSSGGEDACRALADASETRAWVRCRMGVDVSGRLATPYVDDRVDAVVAGESDKEPTILFYADIARGEKNSPDVEAMVYETLLDSVFPVDPYSAYNALCFTPSRQRRLRYLESAMARCRQGTLSDEAKGSAEVAAMLLDDKAMLAKVRKACVARGTFNLSNKPKYRQRLGK